MKYKTKDLFKGENIRYRDPNIDKMLLKEWEESKIGDVSNFPMGYTFLKACEKYTKTTDPKELLKYSFTLPQIEKMLEEPEKKYSLKTDGWSNLFLVPNNEGSVSVVNARRDVRQWRVRVYRLEDDHGWYAGHRFFFHNLSLSPSVPSDPSLTLISQKYKDNETGITADLEGDKITIYPSNGKYSNSFVFKNSSRETVIKVAEALLRIGKLE